MLTITLLRHFNDPYQLTLLTLVFLPIISATPVHHPRALGDGPENSGSTKVAPAVWIPILVVGIVILCFGLVSWSKRSLRRSLANLQNNTNTANANGVREVTADQLAGGATSQTGTGTGARTRRARRPRRTPSQISTTSLPAYNKEPGEEELVIFRGQDMEDAGSLTVVVPRIMTSVQEDDDAEGASGHQRNGSQASSRYPPEEPTTPHDQPLLHEEGEDDDDASSGNAIPLQPPGEDMPQRARRSVDTGRSSNDTNSLTRVETNATDAPIDLGPVPGYDVPSSFPSDIPRGAVPSYFEVVDHPPQQESSAASPDTTSPTNSAGSQDNRRSTFRSLLGAIAHPTRTSVFASFTSSSPHSDSSPTSASSPTNHSRTHNPSLSLSSLSTTSFHPMRPLSSSSTNVLSLTHTRTRSRSNTPLPFASGSRPDLQSSLGASPSMISLNSISAPLPHTLLRSEFTYPKSGPTPEQVKLISSKEALVAGRFGRPWGREAVEYAAAESQRAGGSMDVAPPGFEEVEGAGNAASSSSSLPIVATSSNRGNSNPEEERGERREETSVVPVGSLAVPSAGVPSFAASGNALRAAQSMTSLNTLETFETADDGEEEDEEEEEDTTRRNGPGHQLEATDQTVRAATTTTPSQTLPSSSSTTPANS